MGPRRQPLALITRVGVGLDVDQFRYL